MVRGMTWLGLQRPATSGMCGEVVSTGGAQIYPYMVQLFLVVWGSQQRRVGWEGGRGGDGGKGKAGRRGERGGREDIQDM